MWFLLLKLALFAVAAVSATYTRFTNIQCEALDPTFCSFKKCEIKVLGRGIMGINIHALLLTGFFTNAKVNLSLWRKYNGFRPFMFNKTIDFCDFMSKPEAKLSFERIILDAISKDSNINHSCPYNHDLIAQNLVFREEYFKFLPIPSGEYKLQIIAATNKKWRANVAINMLRKEDLMQS